jgi:hypothetical protein
LAFGHGRRPVVLVEPEYTCRSPGFVAGADVQLLTPVISSRIFSVIVLLVQSTAVSQRASRPHSLQNMNRVTSLVGVANVDRECVKTRSVFVRAHKPADRSGGSGSHSCVDRDITARGRRHQSCRACRT